MFEHGDLFFAYGTLRQDARKAHRGAPPDIGRAFDAAEHLGRASTQGRLHRLGEYAALVASETAEDRVVGDVYRVPERLWAKLDAYEGEHYARESIAVTLDTGQVVRAYAYLARNPKEVGPRIPSGDFLAS